MAIDVLIDKLTELEPPIVERYIRLKRETFEYFEKLSINELDKIRVTLGPLTENWQEISFLVDCLDKNGEHITGRWASYDGARVVLNEERLQRCADKFAKDQVEALKDKMRVKLHRLDSVTNINANAYTCELTFNGALGERKVRAEQNMVFQTSKYGKLFCRWPLLIWVDGKKLSEAQFKALK